MTRVLLVGNPNCGKTTLFNALTGDNQRVGNWPGVTVEKKTGTVFWDQTSIDVTDLPGIYSLVSSPEASQDEQIAAYEVALGAADMIVNVVDACHLERHLYLTSQLLELGKPVIIALTMVDLARQQGITLNKTALSDVLHCPVVSLEAHRNLGLNHLTEAIMATPMAAPMPSLVLSLPVQQQLATIESRFLSMPLNAALVPYMARRFLEGDSLLLSAQDRLALVQTESLVDMDVLMADARYAWVHQVVTLVQQKSSDASERFTAKLDRVVLHRFWALPIFFATMYAMFLFAINIGGVFQDFFDISTDAIFVQGSAWVLESLHAPAWLIALLSNGVGKGINTTLTFVPVIASMFFFLSLLEASGYMARAAFVVDKVMRAFGLPGKSFVPMIVGFGCNVPAIMAARTLDSERDRLLTILMSPFMSCSARLAIYAVFVAAFFPSGGQNIVFSLYCMGILMAVLTGLLLRKTLLRGEPSPLILELPAYHRPTFRRLFREMSLRLRHFIWRAGKVIVPVCLLLGGLNALTIHGDMSAGMASNESVLSWFGRWLTPLFSPMGLDVDNWPATVGLLSGTLAKEVVVGTLNTLYTGVGQALQSSATGVDLIGLLKTAVWSIPNNIAGLGAALTNPILASAPGGDVSHSLYGVMAERFNGKVGAYAYLLFILLYIPCVSTMAVIRQEASRQLMWFSILWSSMVAYAVAVVFYQVATLFQHPWQTLGWCVGMTIFILMVIGFLRRFVQSSGVSYAIATS